MQPDGDRALQIERGLKTVHGFVRGDFKYAGEGDEMLRGGRVLDADAARTRAGSDVMKGGVPGVINPKASFPALNLTPHQVSGALTCAGTPSASRPTGPDCPFEKSHVPGVGPAETERAVASARIIAEGKLRAEAGAPRRGRDGDGHGTGAGDRIRRELLPQAADGAAALGQGERGRLSEELLVRGRRSAIVTRGARAARAW